MSELQANSRTHQGVIREIHTRIVIELPKPFGTVIVDAKADSINKFSRVSMSRFEESIKSNAVVAIELVPPEDMSVLLLSVQANIEDREG